MPKILIECEGNRVVVCGAGKEFSKILKRPKINTYRMD